MSEIIYKLIIKVSTLTKFIFLKFLLLKTFITFEILLCLSIILYRIISNEIWNFIYLLKFDYIFYDTGSLISFLICLEHIYVCYYLIIILAIVYWALYICIVDFIGWNGNLQKFFIKLKIFFSFISLILKKIYIYILKNIKEIVILLELYDIHTKSHSIIISWIKQENYFSVKDTYDEISRPYLLINNKKLKKINYINYLMNVNNLYKIKNKIELFFLPKKINNYLFFSPAKAYKHTNLLFFQKKNNKNKKLVYNFNIFKIRGKYNEWLLLNNFKHSGLFEIIWAVFPSIIIICILIPSLILLYSLEDKLNPTFSVKVIGNQWYWTYEFDNWFKSNKNYYNEDNLIIKKDKLYFLNYAFDSVILQQDDLIKGHKRLLEVNNRLIMPSNTTLRFLISSADVLHAFTIPELGFKVDAVPGRINQILLFINRPGIYYGQCSELCGANHAFMPIVIQSVTNFDTYLKYISTIKEQIMEEHDLEKNNDNKVFIIFNKLEKNLIWKIFQ